HLNSSQRTFGKSAFRISEVSSATSQEMASSFANSSFTSPRESRRGVFLNALNPEKNWKFSANDVKERAFWSDYMAAYEDMIRHTSTQEAPWYVAPADHKWFTRIVVSAAVIETLDALNL